MSKHIPNPNMHQNMHLFVWQKTDTTPCASRRSLSLLKATRAVRKTRIHVIYTDSHSRAHPINTRITSAPMLFINNPYKWIFQYNRLVRHTLTKRAGEEHPKCGGGRLRVCNVISSHTHAIHLLEISTTYYMRCVLAYAHASTTTQRCQNCDIKSRTRLFGFRSEGYISTRCRGQLPSFSSCHLITVTCSSFLAQ